MDEILAMVEHRLQEINPGVNVEFEEFANHCRVCYTGIMASFPRTSEPIRLLNAGLSVHIDRVIDEILADDYVR